MASLLQGWGLAGCHSEEIEQVNMKLFKLLIAAGMLCSTGAFAHGVSEPVGNYNNGCIFNSHSLQISTEHYQVAHPKKMRYFGDESMIRFIERYSRTVHKNGIGSVLVGDVSTKYGGRLNTGHASHQNGLDVDIEFYLDRINSRDLDKPHANILVNKGKQTTNSLFNRKYYDLIMLAAKDPLVERIFVSPAIKVKMCDMTRDESMHKYLHKIRPWFGHTEHFHVRLKCPSHAYDCERQDPIPEMFTIAEEKEDALSWFLPPPENSVAAAPKKTKPALPMRCERLARK